MTDEFEYDVALSFANEDHAAAEKLVSLLTDKHLTVFRDEYTPDQTWGNDLVNHLFNLYNRKAAYCVLLISEHYPLKKWSEEERLAAQERALRDAREYIVLVALDETEIAGIQDGSEHGPLRYPSLERVADFLAEKLDRMPRSSGPPAASHDLRSGNVPPVHSEADNHKSS